MKEERREKRRNEREEVTGYKEGVKRGIIGRGWGRGRRTGRGKRRKREKRRSRSDISQFKGSVAVPGVMQGYGSCQPRPVCYHDTRPRKQHLHDPLSLLSPPPPVPSPPLPSPHFPSFPFTLVPSSSPPFPSPSCMT